MSTANEDLGCKDRHRPGRLSKDIEREQEKGCSDQLQGRSLAVVIHTLELPDHDRRCEDLDQAVEYEAGKRD